MAKREKSRFFIENLLSHSTEKIRRVTLLCFTKFLISKKFMDKKGGVSRFSVENFLSHSAEKFHRGTLLCCVSENFWYRKSLWIRGRGGVSRFSVKNFLSRSVENFRKGILLFSRKFLVSKSFKDEKGGITIFRLKFFVSQCRKISQGYPLGFHYFGYRKILCFRGLCHDFLSEIFCSHSAEKFRRGTLYCVTNAGIEKFCASEGYVTILCRFFRLTVPKNIVEELFCAVFQKSFGSGKVFG